MASKQEQLVYDSFTHICMICGAEVAVINREPVPHTCRIDIA